MIGFPGVGDVRHTPRERVTAMQRARRFASAAVVAALAVSGLAACRSEPGVAAYVGDRRITVERVDAVWTDAKDKLAAAVERVRAEQQGTAAAQDVALPITKQDVLMTLVSVDLLKRFAERSGVRPEAVAPEEVAQGIRLPADAEYLTSYAEYYSYLSGLIKSVKPATVTDTDLRDVLERLVRAGGVDPANVPTVREFAGQLNPQQQQQLGQAIGLREAMKGELSAFATTVNPRYGSGEVPLLSIPSRQGRVVALVALPLNGGTTPAVRDLP